MSCVRCLPLVLAASFAVVGPPAAVVPVPAALAAGTFADPHFREYTIWSGLDKPTAVRFASDGRAFVSQKGGLIKAYDSVSDTTPTTVADLSGDVMNYWDRGLLNMVLDPAFPTKPYLYVFSVWGGPIGERSAAMGRLLSRRRPADPDPRPTGAWPARAWSA